MELINGSQSVSSFGVFYKDQGCKVGIRPLGILKDDYDYTFGYRIRAVKDLSAAEISFEALQAAFPQVPWSQRSSERLSIVLEHQVHHEGMITKVDITKWVDGVIEVIKQKFNDDSKWQDSEEIKEFLCSSMKITLNNEGLYKEIPEGGAKVIQGNFGAKKGEDEIIFNDAPELEGMTDDQIANMSDDAYAAYQQKVSPEQNNEGDEIDNSHLKPLNPAEPYAVVSDVQVLEAEDIKPIKYD